MFLTFFYWFGALAVGRFRMSRFEQILEKVVDMLPVR
jgi:hypothetical protein